MKFRRYQHAIFRLPFSPQHAAFAGVGDKLLVTREPPGVVKPA
jgi:hypothetical protein